MTAGEAYTDACKRLTPGGGKLNQPFVEFHKRPEVY